MNETRLIRTEQLKPGMAIDALGTARTVAEVRQREPHPALPTIDRTVVCTDGWSMSAESDGFVRVPA